MPLTDTHANVTRLSNAGFNPTQAQVIVEVLEDTAQKSRHELVTKEYLRAEIATLKSELIAWLVGLFIAFAGVIITAIKLL